MNKIIQPQTQRLRMRQWVPTDWPAFAQLNADPEVMKYFPSPLSTAESNALADKIHSLIAERGWGLWAVEENRTGNFIGFVGLHIPGAELPCSPCVEVGWRLARSHWGKGYATEAAGAALQVAFGQLELQEVYSFTALNNRRSRAVMERLSMHNSQQNFEHPAIPEGHPLREHVLYKLNNQQWLATFGTNTD